MSAGCSRFGVYVNGCLIDAPRFVLLHFPGDNIGDRTPSNVNAPSFDCKVAIVSYGDANIKARRNAFLVHKQPLWFPLDLNGPSPLMPNCIGSNGCGDCSCEAEQQERPLHTAYSFLSSFLNMRCQPLRE